MKIKASLGNFGHITYGQTIIGKVVYPSENNSHGCNPITDSDFSVFHSDRSSESDTSNFPLFVMVDRGQCSNPTKVRNVENYGGAIALIADYKPEDT